MAFGWLSVVLHTSTPSMFGKFHVFVYLFVKLIFDSFQQVVKESIIILENPSKMSKRQCVELVEEEEKKICEVHLQNPFLT